MSVVSRILTLVLLLTCLLAGLGVALMAAAVIRPPLIWMEGMPRWLLPGTIVFNAGAIALLARTWRHEREFEWLRIGRSTWLWMIVLCYLAGLGVGVMSCA
ncbi:MAG: hypothetical protein QM770_07470 [Tepidisphaeraceae bacterium]